LTGPLRGETLDPPISMTRRFIAAILVALAAGACGESSSRAIPTAPPATPPVIISDAPVARITAFVDYGTVAISDVQQVMLDARASTGEQLQYRIDYGDGTVATAAVHPALAKPNQFFHSYSAPGGAVRSFVATLTVTDAFGRSSSATTTVSVRDVTGIWRSVFANPRSGRTETRVLTLTQTQTRGGVSGTYTHPEGDTEPLSGFVDSPRTLKVAATSQTIRFDGIDLDGSGLDETLTAMTLAVTGGSADGHRLTFVRQ
jgi:PKD domain